MKTITRTLVALAAVLAATSVAVAVCLDEPAPGTCSATSGTPEPCTDTNCTDSVGATISVSIAGPTTCTSASPTDCPTSGCSASDSFITNGAKISVSGSDTTPRRYAICEYINDCDSGDTVTSQCTTVTLIGGQTYTTGGMTRSGAGMYQHIVQAYETTSTTGSCASCPDACATLTLPPGTPACANCTPSIAASCPVTIP